MLNTPILPASKKKKAEHLVIEGLVKLDDQHNDQALARFREAILLGREKIAPYMRNLFDGFVQNRRWDDALAIGKPLTSFYEATDAKLLNQMGNLYRRLGEQALAQEHYKKAIQANKKFDLPYLNLAAMAAKVEVYDEEIKPLMAQFKKTRDFVLPHYEGGSNMLGLLAREVLSQLGDERALDDVVPNELIEFAPRDEMLDQLRRRAVDALEMAAEQDTLGVTSATKHLINLMIYALSHGFHEQAQDALKHLERLGLKHHRYAPLLKAVTLARHDQLEEALSILRNEQITQPKDRYYTANLGLVYRLLKKHHQASVFFIRAGHLLKQSHGYFSPEEIERQAKEFYQERKFPEAMSLYSVMSQITGEARLWRAMGRCAFYTKHHNQAFQLMKEGLGKVSKEEEAEYRAKVYSFFMDETERSLRNKRPDKAMTLLEYALHFHRDASAVERAGQLAYKAGDTFKAAQYQEEYYEMTGSDKVDQREDKRLRYIKLAKEYLSKKEYQSAIHHFELAFDMRLDKDVFMFLASIYKQLKHRRALTSLMQRWKWMLEQEKERQASQELREANEAEKAS